MSHLDKTIKHDIPDYLFKDLKHPDSPVLSPGEIYGANRLWSLIIKQKGSDPFIIIEDLMARNRFLEYELKRLLITKEKT